MPSIELEQLRSVSWGASYLWDLRFPDEGSLPDPFKKWFPAQSVEEPLGDITSFDFDLFNGTYAVPKGFQKKELTVTFYDNSNHDLERWFEFWMNTIAAPDQKYTATLEESVKQLDISRLSLSGGPVTKNSYTQTDRQSPGDVVTRSYWVYPNGTFSFSGDSEPNNLKTFNISFNVVGKKMLENTSVEYFSPLAGKNVPLTYQNMLNIRRGESLFSP